MMRLAVSGLEEPIRRELEPRLRGASFSAYSEAGQRAPFESCDALVVAGGGNLDLRILQQCLSEGKHVLWAALSCITRDGLEALTTAARGTGAQVAVVSPDRYQHSQRLIRQQLDAGKLGEVGLVRIHRWRQKNTAGETVCGLPALLIHDLDLAHGLTGVLPHRVYALERSSQGFVQVHLSFPGGAMALMDCCEQLPPGDGYYSLSVIGSTGAAYADDHHNMQLVYRGGPAQAMRTVEGSKHLALCIQEFVNDLQMGKNFSASVDRWRNVLTIAAAVRKSVNSRQAMSLEDD